MNATAATTGEASSMNLTVAAQMTGADILKLRKKRGILIWSLVLALAPIVIYFVAAVIEHASNPGTGPGQYGPAGGLQNFSDGLRAGRLGVRSACGAADRS